MVSLDFYIDLEMVSCDPLLWRVYYFVRNRTSKNKVIGSSIKRAVCVSALLNVQEMKQ